MPHLFVQNQKVNEFNQRVHDASTGEKFCIKAFNSVTGTALLNLKIKASTGDPRKTIQIVPNFHLSVGERTEIALNVETDDGITNGEGNIVKKTHLTQFHNLPDTRIILPKPSCTVCYKTVSS